MKKIVVISILLWSAVIGWAQFAGIDDQVLLGATNEGHDYQMVLHSDYSIESNHITNDFVNDILFNGHIENVSKDNTQGKLKSVNRLGYHNRNILGFRTLSNQKNWGVFIRLDEFISAKYAQDFFNLILYGNRSSVNETLDLGASYVDYLSTESIEFVRYDLLQSDRVKLDAGIAIQKSSGYQNLDIERGTIFTELEGKYLNGDYDFAYDYNADVQNRLVKLGGVGASLSLNLKHYLDNDHKRFFQLSVQNLGVAHWLESDQFESNQQTQYDGVEIDNLFGADSALNLDGLDDILSLDSSVVNNTKMLPAMFQIGYTHGLNEQLSIDLSLRYWLFRDHLPKLRLSAMYGISESFRLAPSISIMGYTLLDAGVFLGYNKAGFQVGLGLFMLDDLVIESKTTSHAASIQLGYSF